MQKFANAAVGFVLCGFATAAFADEATGTIDKVDTAGRRLVLTDGSIFLARRHVELFAFTVGEKVNVAYSKRGDEKDILSIRPAP